MIHHICIAAQNPLYVANVLAEICHSKVFNFPNPGSYAVFAFDEYGTGIEVFPFGSVCVPASDTEPSKVIQTSSSPDFVATHAAISVPASQQQIEQIGRREGWQVALCVRGASPTENRGPFKVIEFWVENWLMFEFLTPELATGYLQSIRPQIVEQVLGQPIQMTQV
ncbi:hypothetical protein H6G97_41830 [Nostoc flagelliforme FACHB-838]|uniref:Uncharacterized protein n=1 Tax=Nostoc flagelliforme FACHB-838 TaxID=2692904 RepID=A0ABR8E2E4_9NOSO|nr:hypothetical protein [Nostoc flagelliforme]MBD2535578.1 hypothetical protein [Nostoc flagelliforme FACHB-838]